TAGSPAEVAGVEVVGQVLVVGVEGGVGGEVDGVVPPAGRGGGAAVIGDGVRHVGQEVPGADRPGHAVVGGDEQGHVRRDDGDGQRTDVVALIRLEHLIVTVGRDEQVHRPDQGVGRDEHRAGDGVAVAARDVAQIAGVEVVVQKAVVAVQDVVGGQVEVV